jgi:hypothetical protein
MCVVRMDNKWVGLDTALKVQAVLFEMQFMMWAELLSEWHQGVQQVIFWPCAWYGRRGAPI